MKMLRWSLTAIAILALLQPLSATTLWPDPNGMPAWQSQLVSPDATLSVGFDNNTLVVWEDSRNGHRQLFGQVVESNYLPYWEEGGIPLVANP